MSPREIRSPEAWLAERARAALETGSPGSRRLRFDGAPGVEIAPAPGLVAAWDALLAFVGATAPPMSEVGLSVAPPPGRLHAVGAACIVLRWQVEGSRLSGDDVGGGGELQVLRPGVRRAARLATGADVAALSVAFAEAGWRCSIEALESEELLASIERHPRSAQDR